MERGFIANAELPYNPGKIRELCPHLIFASAKILAKQLVQPLFKSFFTSHKSYQPGKVMLNLPQVCPSVILIIIVPASHSAIKNGINFYPAAGIIFWHKEAFLFRPEIFIILRSFYIKVIISVFADLFCHLSQCPVVIA